MMNNNTWYDVERNIYLAVLQGDTAYKGVPLPTMQTAGTNNQRLAHARLIAINVTEEIKNGEY